MKSGQQPNPYNPAGPQRGGAMPTMIAAQPPMMGQQMGQQMIAPMTIGDVGQAHPPGQQMNPTQQPVQAQGYGMNPQRRQMMAQALTNRYAPANGQFAANGSY